MGSGRGALRASSRRRAQTIAISGRGSLRRAASVCGGLDACAQRGVRHRSRHRYGLAAISPRRQVAGRRGQLHGRHRRDRGSARGGGHRASRPGSARQGLRARPRRAPSRRKAARDRDRCRRRLRRRPRQHRPAGVRLPAAQTSGAGALSHARAARWWLGLEDGRIRMGRTQRGSTSRMATAGRTLPVDGNGNGLPLAAHFIRIARLRKHRRGHATRTRTSSRRIATLLQRFGTRHEHLPDHP